MPVRGLLVSRAYINPVKPLPKANFLFLLGFLRFFWKCRSGWIGQILYIVALSGLSTIRSSARTNAEESLEER